MEEFSGFLAWLSILGFIIASILGIVHLAKHKESKSGRYVAIISLAVLVLSTFIVNVISKGFVSTLSGFLFWISVVGLIIASILGLVHINKKQKSKTGRKTAIVSFGILFLSMLISMFIPTSNSTKAKKPNNITTSKKQSSKGNSKKDHHSTKVAESKKKAKQESQAKEESKKKANREAKAKSESIAKKKDADRKKKQESQAKVESEKKIKEQKSQAKADKKKRDKDKRDDNFINYEKILKSLPDKYNGAVTTAYYDFGKDKTVIVLDSAALGLQDAQLKSVVHGAWNVAHNAVEENEPFNSDITAEQISVQDEAGDELGHTSWLGDFKYDGD